MRVTTAIYLAEPDASDNDEAVAKLFATRKSRDVDPDFLRSGVVKVFADGVMEYPAQTAALLSPYLDENGKPTSIRANSISIRSASPAWFKSSMPPVLPCISTP